MLIVSALLCGSFAVAPIGPTGCTEATNYLKTPQGSAILATSETVANVALSAAATTYAGPVAGQLTSAGLNALGTVLQGYIDRPVPASVVKASPGVSGVGVAVAPLISTQKPVDQKDVDAVYQAAAIALKK